MIELPNLTEYYDRDKHIFLGADCKMKLNI